MGRGGGGGVVEGVVHKNWVYDIYLFAFLQGLERTLDDHKILLLEAAPEKTEDVTSVYSNRVSNITPGSKKLLESESKLEVSLLEWRE